jgi:ankyrin repeat protein
MPFEERNVITLLVLPVMLAFGFMAWSAVKIVKDVRGRKVIRIRDCIVLGATLTVVAFGVCLVMIIAAGLGHSTCEGHRAHIKCLITLVIMVVCPVAGLVLFRHYQKLNISRDQTWKGGSQKLDLKSFRIAALLTALSIATVIVLLIGKLSLWPPLMFALRNDYSAMANLLIRNGFISNVRDICGHTPLPYAALTGKTEMAKRLTEAGADVNAEDKNDMTALSWAVLYKNTELAKYLVERGALVNPPRKDQTPLMRAARSGNGELTKFLLDRGANVNARGPHGSALSFAVRADNVEIARLLIDHGADTEIKTASEWTPLMLACHDGRVELVRLLLEQGANPLAKSYAQETPLKLATKGGHHEVVEMLKALTPQRPSDHEDDLHPRRGAGTGRH